MYHLHCQDEDSEAVNLPRLLTTHCTIPSAVMQGALVLEEKLMLSRLGRSTQHKELLVLH